MRAIIIALLLAWGVVQAEASTWYVRPASDGNGGPTLTYGTGDGSSSANAFSGFAAITGVAAGDTVCLPGSDEPFFERLDTGTAGTAGLRVTYAGCGSTKALIWSAQGLSGERSFNASRAAVSSAAYAWAEVAPGIYRKRIDVRPRMLWQDDTWLQPVDINSTSEATIIATLNAGEWGVRDNGDSTYRIYYRGSAPTSAVIRCDNVPISGGAQVGIVRVDLDYQTFSNIEIRGHTATSQPRAMDILSVSHIKLADVLFLRNEIGPSILNVTAAGEDYQFDNVRVLHSSVTGLYLSPGLGLSKLTVTGGEYSYSSGSTYNGSGFTAGDGDGIGLGQGGGTAQNLLFRRASASHNANAGIFSGTSFAMTVTNLVMVGMTFDGNGRNCFGEGNPSRVVGKLVLGGFLCLNTPQTSTAPVSLGTTPGTPRDIVIANGTFSGNRGLTNILFRPHADNNYVFANLVFVDNPGTAVGADRGDLYSNEVALVGDEVFKNLYFYSRPGQAKTFAKIGATFYMYNSANINAFATATGATGSAMNVDPLLMSTTDFRPRVNSPLKRAGSWWGNECTDVRGRGCFVPLDIGAYQSSSGDPANARAARN